MDRLLTDDTGLQIVRALQGISNSKNYILTKQKIEAALGQSFQGFFNTDKSLTQSDKAADALATGTRLTSMDGKIQTYQRNLSSQINSSVTSINKDIRDIQYDVNNLQTNVSSLNQQVLAIYNAIMNGGTGGGSGGSGDLGGSDDSGGGTVLPPIIIPPISGGGDCSCDPQWVQAVNQYIQQFIGYQTRIVSLQNITNGYQETISGINSTVVQINDSYDKLTRVIRGLYEDDIQSLRIYIDRTGHVVIQTDKEMNSSALGVGALGSMILGQG